MFGEVRAPFDTALEASGDLEIFDELVRFGIAFPVRAPAAAVIGRVVVEL